MLRFVWALALTLGVSVFAAEPIDTRPNDPPIKVECHGKLRQGMMAIVGETTGTTVTFDGVIWELKLPDEPSCKFAAEHHKQPVTVVGALRQVAGTERPHRWIVDVTRLSERDVKTKCDGATMTVKGLLQKQGASGASSSTFIVVSENMAWKLNLPEDNAIRAKAESLMTKPVVINGRIERVPGKDLPPKMVIGVDKIDAAPMTP